jgi:hypothetical protein
MTTTTSLGENAMPAMTEVLRTTRKNGPEGEQPDESIRIPTLGETHIEISKNGSLYQISICGDRGAEIVNSFTNLLIESNDLWCLESKITVGGALPRP